MKQSRWIWILGITAVVLIGIFIIVDINTDKKEREKHIADGKQLLHFDVSKVTGLSLKNEEGTLAFEWDTENGEWRQTEGEAFHVSTYAVNAIVNYACDLQSLKTVALNSDSKEVYGFTDPIELKIYTTETGKDHPYIIYVGDNTPTYEAYYAMIDGSDEIYTIDYNSGTVFCASRNALKNAYLFDTTAAQVSYMRFEKDGKTTVELSRDSERAWQMLQPEGFTLAKAYVDELSDDLVHITVDAFVEDNPSDLEKHGLDKPQTQVFLKGSSGTRAMEEEIWFGAPLSEDPNETDLYGYFVTSKQVFSIKKAETTFANTPASSLILPYCADITLDDVKSIDIDMGEVYDLKAKAELDLSGEQFKLDGRDISGMYDETLNTLFKNFCRSVATLGFTEMNLDAKPDPDADADMTILYRFKDGSKKELTFRKKSANEFYLFTDGKYSGLTVRLNKFTDSASVTSSYEALKQALKSKK